MHISEPKSMHESSGSRVKCLNIKSNTSNVNDEL